MSGRLSGRIAVVTGAGSRGEGIGTGRAISVLFSREGATVLLVDRDRDAAEATLAMITADGGEAAVLQADVTSGEECQSIADEATRRWGRVDALVNNVGTEGPGTVLNVEPAEWDRVMTLNLQTAVRASRAIVPVIAASGGGSVINLASIAALRPHGITPYSAAKGAVIALTTSMALDHARALVRVNCIAPGPIYTPMVAAKGMSEEVRARRRDASPLKLEGTAWDVAWAAVYLASDEARWVTGQVLRVDGGVSVSSPER